MKNIIITGFMGTGKSSVARRLALKMGLKPMDTDELIEKEAGMSVKDIFRTSGEKGFRALEKTVIERLSQGGFGHGLVLATGGGAVIDPVNREALRRWGVVINLRASIDEILERVGKGDERPLLNEKDNRFTVETLLKQRQEAYLEADLVIDTTKKNVEEVVSLIADFLCMRTVRVELAERSYPIYIRRGIIESAGSIMKKAGLKGKAAVVTNPVVKKLFLKPLVDSLKNEGFDVCVIEVPDGEEYKTLENVSLIYDRLIEERMERTSPIIALGGGVIGDITGFVAATYLRGVPYIQVPTTLLAQVDSSIGGKTAVNHSKGKNLIGSFYQPSMVIIDPDVLKTLAERHLSAGFAEVVKYGAIRDRAFFSFLEKNTKSLKSLCDEALFAIELSCRIKASIVSADERESDQRAILNFGHTFGHAVETLTGYSRYMHGEAVAIGMVMAGGLSVRKGLCPEDVLQRIKSLLEAFSLPVCPPKIKPSDFIDCMRLDKKVKDKKIRFILLREIGEVVITEVHEEELLQFLS
ncbi:MAG: 3-dehydroquinate synthase [Deltaproteobacteria bacterium]|nr:3-dehydroquinate synthase [Deltaproteobacteria bacterium]